MKALSRLYLTAFAVFSKMSSVNNTTYVEDYYFNPPFVLSIPTRFWLYLISNISSILCSLFVLYHLLFDRTLRQAVNNHVVIVALILGLFVELIDIPLILHFYRFGNTWKVNPTLILFWSFIDYCCFTTQIIIFAWATIERHILIFHARWISTKRKCFFVHYLPIIILLLYCFIYYSIIAFYPFCTSVIFQSPVIGVFVPCAYDNIIITQWDLLCHVIIPTFVIVICSIALLVRVLWQKSRLRQAFHWRKQRKIIIQSLTISILYLTFNFPWVIVQFAHELNLLMDFGINIMAYTIYFSYYIIFLFPFVCCGSIPKLRKRLKKFILCQRMGTVAPA